MTDRNQVIIVAIICMTIISIAATVPPAGSGWEAGAGSQTETGDAMDENEILGRVVRYALI